MDTVSRPLSRLPSSGCGGRGASSFKRDFSEVALKRGVPPADPEKYAPYTAAVNVVAGAIAVAVILMVVLAGVRVRYLDGDCRVYDLDEVLCRLYCQS
jgi:hypothetical protein